ncbi:XRE family transcriptional regulator [Bacterioplanes sanyensis]|uniref:XRE family transcriptional regulator n=1 Tax=Bacterioplanes sanyensis TaxID=1249553 RepID=A0A222FI28_9GAMM|nr:DeoR family transcriptional regulator [Bacterioplanes sanyensis]ASP38071.1 XRE family transcriptional regulator [Bacterioplanes sanyensis]
MRGVTQQRRQQILTLLQQHGEVQVEPLARQLQTSEVTIRKDLKALEASGVLVRRYGGAIAAADGSTFETGSKISNRKKAIAAAAAQGIRDHQRIIIDSGSTASAIIPFLEQRRGMVVMSNSLLVARQVLALENEPTLLMTGGTWDGHSESFQGQVAEQVLQAYDFDQLFIGCDGIDLQHGTTTFNELLTLSRTMAQVSRQVVLMAESDKIGRRIPNQELAWQQIDVFITDSGISREQQQQIEAHGVQIDIVTE